MSIKQNEVVLEYTYSGFFNGGMFAGHNMAPLMETRAEDYRMGLMDESEDERKKTAITILSSVHEVDLKTVASLIKPSTDIFSSIPGFNVDAICEINSRSGDIEPAQRMRIQDFYGDFIFKTDYLTMKCLIYKVTGDEFRKTCCRDRMFEVVNYSAKIS